MNEQLISVDDLSMNVRIMGEGEPVLLLHGWPTSSYLWRNIMPHLAQAGFMAIAPDLIGFGKSDKPIDQDYTLPMMCRYLTKLLDALEVDTFNLCVHDLGGPVGLYWAMQNQDRVLRIGLLNTLVYSDFSMAVKTFVRGAKTPGVKSMMTSPWGLATGMKLGVGDKRKLTKEAIKAVQAPFVTKQARIALAKSGSDFKPSRFEEIEASLTSITCPFGILYGEKDRILPDVASTMARLKMAIPHTTIASLPECGHFLQEEAPDEIAEWMIEVFQRDLE